MSLGDEMIRRHVRGRLLATSVLTGLVGLATTAQAQQAGEVQEVVVTGSRIVRQDYVANSPVTTVAGEKLVDNADITLDTYLNTLPQVAPSGTTTSNNPGNGGQSNIDLRGMGSNRNVVLVDGRRPMVSANTLTVDLNTIPAALIESVEVITGGAGAAYGADAIAGAVNIKLKRNFEGLDLRANYSNSTEHWDAKEWSVSGVLGGNFADGRGNGVLAFDRSLRQQLIKSQRAFASVATATTSFLPEGTVFWAGANAPTQASIDTVFAGYGVAPGKVAIGSGTLGFNTDGTLFYRGIFNSPFNVQNFRYPVDLAVNTTLFPDVYSYNFDAVNILSMPLDRTSFTGKINYELENGIEIFAQVGWTRYQSTSALAPSPVSTITGRPPGENDVNEYSSALISRGASVASQLVVPVTNPFLPADLRAILNSRTGDDPALVGSGATEPFRMRSRILVTGLRQSDFENSVVQYLGGARGTIGDTSWRWEAYVSEGITTITQTQSGNIDTQKLQEMLEDPNGGRGMCAGGYNPFGRNPISAACAALLELQTTIRTRMVQDIGQAYITGEAFQLPAGPLSVVLGAEYRGFEFDFDPGAAGGAVSGFNAQDPASGTNSFKDIFAEALLPLLKDAPLAKSLELNLGYRRSTSEFADKLTGIEGDEVSSNAYKVELNWQPVDFLRLRASYQRSVRAPNFGELFAGTGSAPQYFDPCSVTSNARAVAGAKLANLCIATNLAASAINTYVQTPGTQVSIDINGNPNLKPETGSTITLGATASSPWDNQWLSRLRGSFDWYSIEVKEAILGMGVNQVIASCYNYYGTNPNYSVTHPACQTISRAGGDILGLVNPAAADEAFTGRNDGHIKTTGFDIQVDWGFDLEWLGAPAEWGSVTTNLLVNHISTFEQYNGEVGAPTLDFAGTVTYFGEALGTNFGVSNPKWKVNWNTAWRVGPVTLNARARFIDAMKNRASVQFPGETSFVGVPKVWYWDFAGAWDITDNVTLRVGVNNAFDKQPPVYQPNVQSGTEPSLYDVIGRRVFTQLNLRF